MSKKDLAWERYHFMDYFARALAEASVRRSGEFIHEATLTRYASDLWNELLTYRPEGSEFPTREDDDE